MKTRFPLLIILITLTFSTFAQQNSKWNNWAWLMGDWKGEGSGQPGQGDGTFSFKTDLDDQILVRHSHAEFPASGDRPAAIHNDLMIISLDFEGNPSKAVYFDNEGHTINYTVTYAPYTVILQSEKIPNVPIFRLTYHLIDNHTVNTKFELSQDGEKFMTYIEGKSRKMN